MRMSKRNEEGGVKVKVLNELMEVLTNIKMGVSEVL